MDMKKMMKQAQKMQRDAALAQEEIAAMTFEASAGGGGSRGRGDAPRYGSGRRERGPALRF